MMALMASQYVQRTHVLDEMASAQLKITKDATARNQSVQI